ncbi:DUF5663 domain-containing protein [Syntrophobacter fumaroxidans]|uniref:Uncharacterized protein n=1 Tax=Syntrophobacter fumaroxidans (strain DSM 10017 / MPOB) TaxID=335543 RepID=A0LH48_SYNFM|nr:DUF5663 domain-containing protein [Syntrophobacter fumaroxidans]ABK16750.1 hypothetical protein Sfum_1056 [Syntrophobacter fumaroxidans MPOB]
MSQKEPEVTEPRQAGPSQPIRNPYILNFCKVLVERKSEKVEGEALKKLLNDMYRLFECMLGQNMIAALPEDLRKEYLTATEDLSKLTYEKIGEVFDRNVPDYERIMKDTMKQFAEIFLRNRHFRPEDYPVPMEAYSVQEPV